MTSEAEIEELRQRRARSFGAVADEYDRLRPQVPDEAMAWLVPAGCRDVVDLGAGTGLLTRRLVGMVADVVAVEPDPRMREVLTRRTPGVTVLEGRAERLPLPDAGVDCILMASAWHWVNPAEAFPEIARVLRDGGRLGLVWTTHDRSIPWVAGLDAARATSASRLSAGVHRVELPSDVPFAGAEEAVFTFDRTLPVDDVLALMGTYSAAIIAPDGERAEGLARTELALRERFPGGLATIPHRCVCWRSARTRR